MKKKIPVWVIVVVAIIVVGAVIGGIILAVNANPDKKAIKAVEKQMQTLLAKSDEVAAYAPDDNANNIGEFVYSKMTYEVIAATDTNCTIRVTAPSLYKVFQQIYDPDNIELATDIEGYNAVVEGILEQIYSCLTNGEYEMVTADVAVSLNANGELQMTRELLDAMYGGLITLQDELAEQYVNGIKEK